MSSAADLATCPECGGWPRISVKRASGARTYGCKQGHSWTIAAPRLRMIDGGAEHHEYALDEPCVYIAGPMAGLPDHGFPAFEAAEQELRHLGVTVLSPHEDVSPRDLKKAEELGSAWRRTDEYRRYLLRDLRMVAKCDVLALLPGYEESGGALAEVSFAHACGMIVVGYKDLVAHIRGELSGS